MKGKVIPWQVEFELGIVKLNWVTWLTSSNWIKWPSEEKYLVGHL